MINITRLNGKEITLNAELIEIIEETPDTIITLTTGKKLIVSEAREVIVQKVIDYRRNINRL